MVQILSAPPTRLCNRTCWPENLAVAAEPDGRLTDASDRTVAATFAPGAGRAALAEIQPVFLRVWSWACGIEFKNLLYAWLYSVTAKPVEAQARGY